MPTNKKKVKKRAKSDEVILNTDENAGPWVPLDNVDMFCGDGSIDLDKTNWNQLDYAVKRDHDWYTKKFPGFPEEIIDILVKCDGSYEDPKEKQNIWEKRRELNKSIVKRHDGPKTIHFD